MAPHSMQNTSHDIVYTNVYMQCTASTPIPPGNRMINGPLMNLANKSRSAATAAAKRAAGRSGSMQQHTHVIYRSAILSLLASNVSEFYPHF